MNAMKKILPILIVAIVVGTGTYFIGKGQSSTDFEASVYKISPSVATRSVSSSASSSAKGNLIIKKPVDVSPVGLVHLMWYANYCGVWRDFPSGGIILVGATDISQKDCHDVTLVQAQTQTK